MSDNARILAKWGYKDGRPTYRLVLTDRFIMEHKGTDSQGKDAWVLCAEKTMDLSPLRRLCEELRDKKIELVIVE